MLAFLLDLMSERNTARLTLLILAVAIGTFWFLVQECRIRKQQKRRTALDLDQLDTADH